MFLFVYVELNSIFAPLYVRQTEERYSRLRDRFKTSDGLAAISGVFCFYTQYAAIGEVTFGLLS